MRTRPPARPASDKLVSSHSDESVDGDAAGVVNDSNVDIKWPFLAELSPVVSALSNPELPFELPARNDSFQDATATRSLEFADESLALVASRRYAPGGYRRPSRCKASFAGLGGQCW